MGVEIHACCVCYIAILLFIQLTLHSIAIINMYLIQFDTGSLQLLRFLLK